MKPDPLPAPPDRPRPRPGILDIEPYVAGKSKAPGGERALKLSSNENPYGPSPKAIDAYREHSNALHRYPESGAPSLIEALAQTHKLDASRIVCGSGSDELISLLIHAYAGPGDEVLMSAHGFLMYKIYAQGAGAAVVTAPEKDLTADVNALLAAVTPKTRLLFLANPNNPTGSYLPASELKRLRANLRPDIILAVDAAYAEFVDRPDYGAGRELVDAGENTVMLRTFSKIYGLASLRLGWAYCPLSIAQVLNRVRGPFNVSGPALAAGIAALRDKAYTAQMRRRNVLAMSWVEGELMQLGFTVRHSVANFLLLDLGSPERAQEIARFLAERGVIVREVSAYGLPQYLRITIGTEPENRALAGALKEYCSR